MRRRKLSQNFTEMNFNGKLCGRMAHSHTVAAVQQREAAVPQQLLCARAQARPTVQSGSSLLGVRQQVPSSLASKRPKTHIHRGAETRSRFQARSPVVARPLKGRTTRIGALGSSHKLLPPSRRAGVDHKPSATAAPLHTAMPGHHNGHSDDVSSPQPHARTLPIHTSPSVTCLALPWTRTSPRRPLPHRSSAPRRHTATIGG